MSSPHLSFLQLVVDFFTLYFYPFVTTYHRFIIPSSQHGTNNTHPLQSPVSISDADAKLSTAQKTYIQAETRCFLPSANNKIIEKGFDVSKLTKKEIIAVLLIFMG
jgi:hypothetical protein